MNLTKPRVQESGSTSDPEKTRNPNPNEGSGLANVSRHHMVELGGIESLEFVWLGVDLCWLVVVSCDDAV